MKILFLTYGAKKIASSRLRVYQYLPYLKKNYSLISYYNLRLGFFRRIGTIINLIRFMFLLTMHDTIFIQKVILPAWSRALLFRLNKRIIFDMDDLLPSNPALYDTKSCEAMLRGSDHILLATDYNFGYTRRFNQNISVITGPIDCERYRPRKYDKTDCVIGWIGSPPTEKYIGVLSTVLKNIKNDFNVKVELIGTRHFRDLGDPKKWSLRSEVKDLENFDIGIMPLFDNEWARGKAGYKLLQYMAMGIPAVASPVGINKDIVIDGITGFLCRTNAEWIDKLGLLISDAPLRKKMGMAARQRAVKHFSLESAKETFIRILEGPRK